MSLDFGLWTLDSLPIAQSTPRQSRPRDSECIHRAPRRKFLRGCSVDRGRDETAAVVHRDIRSEAQMSARGHELASNGGLPEDSARPASLASRLIGMALASNSAPARLALRMCRRSLASPSLRSIIAWMLKCPRSH